MRTDHDARGQLVGGTRSFRSESTGMEPGSLDLNGESSLTYRVGLYRTRYAATKRARWPDMIMGGVGCGIGGARIDPASEARRGLMSADWAIDQTSGYKTCAVTSRHNAPCGPHRQRGDRQHDPCNFPISNRLFWMSPHVLPLLRF